MQSVAKPRFSPNGLVQIFTEFTVATGQRPVTTRKLGNDQGFATVRPALGLLRSMVPWRRVSLSLFSRSLIPPATLLVLVTFRRRKVLAQLLRRPTWTIARSIALNAPALPERPRIHRVEAELIK